MTTVGGNSKKVGEKRTPIPLPFAKHLTETRHGLRIQNLTHQAKNGFCKVVVTVAVTVAVTTYTHAHIEMIFTTKFIVTAIYGIFLIINSEFWSQHFVCRKEDENE